MKKIDLGLGPSFNKMNGNAPTVNGKKRNGNGNALGFGKIDLGLKLLLPSVASAKTNQRRLKPIQSNDPFKISFKQNTITPLKRESDIGDLSRRINQPISVADRVGKIMNGGLALSNGNGGSIIKPTASKIRDGIRAQAAGRNPRSIFSNREFQVSFVTDGVVQQRTFKTRDKAGEFKAKIDAAGLTEEVSTIREIRI